MERDAFTFRRLVQVGTVDRLAVVPGLPTAFDAATAAEVTACDGPCPNHYAQ